MTNEPNDSDRTTKNQAYHRRKDDGTDLICSAIDYLRGVLHKDGDAYWKANTFRQKTHLEEWAKNLDLHLDADHILPQLVRGGQEHDLYEDQDRQRIIKVTRNNFFGLSPGIQLTLVSSSKDARCLHLWEASPYQYLERLLLHNKLVPCINELEGIITQGDDIAIVTSQPQDGFLNFIQDCLASGHSVTLDKTSHTSDRNT